MIRKSGVLSWPPEWTPVGRVGGSGEGNVRGELGTLYDATMNKLIPNKVFLAMDHRAHRYITVLAFDDEPFANQLYGLLLDNIVRSIKEIGDLNLSHLL